MKELHPTTEQLALYAGGDLPWWESRSVRGHVAACESCRREVNTIRAAIDCAQSSSHDMPPGLNWNSLAEEMTANIHVGMEAGECVAGFERSLRPSRPKLAWHTAGILACATGVVVVTLWLNLPPAQMDHLVSALSRIRLDRFGMLFRNSPALASMDGVILEAGPDAIELRANGSGMALIRKRTQNGAPEGKVSVNGGSAGVQFVDADTDQVTINTVYYAH